MSLIGKRSSVVAAALIAAAGIAVPSGAAHAHGVPGRLPGYGFPGHGFPSHGGHDRLTVPTLHAVFVQTDDPAGNQVIAYDRTASGGLVRAGTYATGGKGAALDQAVADDLASQGSLTYDSSTHLLYAVNAGSNTITVFSVVGDKLVRRQVVSSGGSFPVSVTAHGGLVYVLNARDGGSIQGYAQLGGFLAPVPSWHRSLGLDLSVAPEFVASPGEVSFTPDGSRLLVTTKASGDSVLVYRLGLFGPSAPTVNDLPGGVPFGFVWDERGNLVLTQAGAGSVSTYKLKADGTITAIDTEITGGEAVCWVIGDNGYFYVSNTGSGTLSRYSESHSGDLSKLGDVTVGAGPVDSAISSDGKFLYLYAGVSAEVDVFRIGPNGSLTQTATISVPGGDGGQGIAAL